MDLAAITDSLIDLFYPKRCLVCEDVITKEETICIHCVAKLSFTDWKFGQNNPAYFRLSALADVENALSLLVFSSNNVTQKLIHYLKYKNQPELGILFADKIILPDMDFAGIIPIPIHPKRERKRGYNQIIPFAKRLSERLQIPLIDTVLVRVKNDSSQITRGTKHRLERLSNSFQTETYLKSGHYILVDDVLTTGATLSNCIRILKTFENIKISVVTIACVL